jgi:hypothetical protein
MGNKDKIAGQGGWNPTKECWQFTDVYWEKGDPWDIVWESDDCYVSRVEFCLWIEVSCYDGIGKNNLVLRERSRETQRCYVLAERFCKKTLYKAWTENSGTNEIQYQDWNIEGDFWEDVEYED